MRRRERNERGELEFLFVFFFFKKNIKENEGIDEEPLSMKKSTEIKALDIVAIVS